MLDFIGWQFFFGLMLGTYAGAGLAALFFAYLPPPNKTWMARGARNVLTVRRAPTLAEIQNHYHITDNALADAALQLDFDHILPKPIPTIKGVRRLPPFG